MFKERRALRRRLMLKCSYAADAHIVSISVNGCLIESWKTPKIGDRVEFSAELRGQPTILRGVVVHLRGSYEFGVRFEGLDEDAASRVRTTAAS